MNEILQKKMFKIGKKVLDELKLHETDIMVSMKRSLLDVNGYLISVNSHPTVHISEDEIIDFRKHEND